MKRCLFLDRDGTINVYKGFVYKVEELEIIEGAFDVVKRFQEAGWKIAVISNQAGVGSGLYTMDDVKKVEAEIVRRGKACGVSFDAFYYCPHSPNPKGLTYCTCRKPRPGMILQGIADLGVDKEGCYLFGDNITDLECAANAGIRYYDLDFTNAVATSSGKRVVFEKYTPEFIEDLFRKANGNA